MRKALIAGIVALAPAVAGAFDIPAELQQKIDRCFSEKTGAVCTQAGNQLRNQSGPHENQELIARVFKTGCDAADLPSCNAYAFALINSEDTAQKAEGLRVLETNCRNGYLISCEHRAVAYQQAGDLAGARALYAQLCTSAKEGLRGCTQYGKLSTADADRVDLNTKCNAGQEWACLALGHAELTLKNKDTARAAFFHGCRLNGPNAKPLCDAAVELVHLPPDAAEFIDKQKMCAHWYGEDPGDKGRSKEVIEGIARDCIDRSADYSALTKKYAANKDLLFVLKENQFPGQ
jgi:hypothetical protein